MRILHVLWGFSPWRGGGLVAYAEDTMKVQAASGQTVAAFFAGRRDLWNSRPHLTIWHLNGIKRYEIRNSPIVNFGSKGAFPPGAELEEPFSEQSFVSALNDFLPDIVHFHELACLPFSIIDICSNRGIPSLLTLHDYFSLCPTLFLFTKKNINCDDLSGNSCHLCVSAHCDGGFRDRIRSLNLKRGKWIYYLISFIFYIYYLVATKPKLSKQELIEIHQKRFQQNLFRINKINILLAQSNRVKEIYGKFTGRNDIKVLHSAPSHLNALKPRRFIQKEGIINFATINGAVAPYKGLLVLVDAMKILRKRGLENKYLLHIFGGISPLYFFSILNLKSIRWHGNFAMPKLDVLLEKIDVGLMPSVWEEVYGFVGIEFIAKGIPVIGNKIGGIPDYTVDGCTGWLNNSCSAQELADIMTDIINNPEEIKIRNEWILKNKNLVVADTQKHNEKLINYYEEAISKNHA